MDSTYILQVANETRRQLVTLTPTNVLLSWGIENFQATEYKGMPCLKLLRQVGLRFGKLSKLFCAHLAPTLRVNGKVHPLKPELAEAINQNNRILWVEKFCPTTEAERDLLCRFYKVDNPKRVTISDAHPQQHTDAVNRLRELFDDKSVENLRNAVRGEGYLIHEEQDSTYAIDFHRHIIINLDAEGFDVKRVQWQRKQPQSKQQHKPAVTLPRVPKLRDAGGGSQSEKREWEVGHKGNYDEVDDGRSLKM